MSKELRGAGEMSKILAFQDLLTTPKAQAA